MGGSSRSVEIIVECSTIAGELEQHIIYIHDNGFVETFDHDKADWSLDGETYEFLGGPKDINPCLWWKKINSQEKEYCFWRDGKMYIRSWDNAVIDISHWVVSVIGESTIDSFDSIMKGFGVAKEKKSFIGNDYDIFNTQDYVMLIELLRKEFNDIVYFSRLQELMLACTLDEILIWHSHNVPYESIVPLKSLGVPVVVAEEICKEYFERWKIFPQPHSLGSPEYWVTATTQKGMDMSRIADYMERTRYNGLWYWRENVYKKVLQECSDNNVEYPQTWIVEAVASIPDREVLIHYTTGENFVNSNMRVPHIALEQEVYPRSEKWTRGWAYTTGVERIITNLVNYGDPKTWEPGWEYPTLNEIKNDYYETIEERALI